MPPLARLLAPVALVVLLTGRPATAQPTPDFTWNNFISAGTTWSVGANWLGGNPPVSSIDLDLGFGNSPLQTAGGYTSTFNGGAFDVNSLVFANSGSAGTTAIALAGNSFPDTIRFNTSSTAVLPSIWMTGAGRVVIGNGNATAGVTLNNGTNLQILGNGIGELQLTATIVQAGAGNSGITINQTGTQSLNTGTLVRLSGVNTFAGGVTLTAGNLVLANNAALGTGTLTVNGGSLQFDPASAAGFTIANAINLNSTLVVTGTNSAGTVPNPVATFSGVISGSGGITFNNTNGALVYALTGANTFTGQLTVLPFGNTAVTVQLGTAAVSTGTATGASGLSASYNSLIVLDNRAGVLTRLNTTTAPTLTLNTATFRLIGNSTANASETFSTFNVGGQGSLSILGNSAAAQTTTVNFAGLNRGATGTIQIVATNLGSNTGAGESILRFTSNPGGAIGGSGSTGSTTISILPYAFANSAASTAATTATPVIGLVRWDSGTQRIVPLNTANEYATSLFLARDTAPTTNQRFASTSALPNAFGVAGLVNPTTINAIVLDTNTTAANRIGTSLEGSGVLTVASGAILTAVNGSTTDSTLGSMINLGGLNFGPTTGYVHSVAALTINSPITGSGGLVKSGAATLALNGTNSVVGGLTVNAGLLQFSSDANLGAAGETLNLNGGSGGGIQFQPNNLFTAANQAAETVNRPVTLGPSGSQVNVGLANNTLTLAGTISGSGQLFKNGAGILNLTGTNSYTGNTTVLNGILAASNDAALGDPSSSLILVGSFQPLASFSMNRSIVLTGAGSASSIFTNGQNLTLNGNLASQASGTNPFLLKAGLGDLILTNTNNFTGNLQVGDPSGIVRASNPSGAQTAGRVILSGPNGAVPMAAQALVLGNGELVLDNSVAVNNNRIGNVTVGAAGGNITLIGNASAPVNESIGLLTTNVAVFLGGTVTLSTPAGSGQSTTLTSTSYSFINPATLFVRGTNLGASSGDRTAVIFAANPAQTGGIIASMVGATSETSEPTDFLTTTVVTVNAPNSNQFALVPFTSYSALPLSGAGNAGSTFDVTGASVLTGASAANALRIRGGSVDIGGGTLTLTAGAVLATGGANGGITNGTLAFGTNAARITVATGSDLTIGATITGTTGFNKFGNGTLTLNTPATVTATAGTNAVVVGQGTLRYGVANALPIATALIVHDGAVLDLNNNSSTLGTVQGYGNVNLGTANLTLNSGTAPSFSFAGALIGSGNLIKDGINGVTFAGNSPGFSGGVSILRGALTVTGTGGLGTGTTPILLGATSGTDTATLALGSALPSFSRDITVQAGSTPGTPHTLQAGPNIMTISSNITLNQTLRLSGLTTQPIIGNEILTGTISGTGGITVFGGSWTLSGNNTYSGTTTLDNFQTAVFAAGSDTAFGTGSLSFTSFGANLRAANGPRTLANNITIQSGGYFGVAGTDNLTLNGTVNLSGVATAVPLNIMNTATTTLGGTIQSGTGGISKIGPGVLVLTGNNTYSGTTTVNAGTLAVNNTAGSGTGLGNVAVNSGAILAGSGIIGDGGARTVTVNPRAVVRPGSNANDMSPLTVNSTSNVTFAGGSILQSNVGANPTDGGRLVVTGGGTADLTGISAVNPLNIYLNQVQTVGPSTPYSVTVIDSGATAILFPGGTFDPSHFNVTMNFDVFSFSVTNPTPGTLVVNFTPIPEPTSVLLVVAGAAGLVATGRRLRRRTMQA